jgi:predicted RNase H-like nuclease
MAKVIGVDGCNGGWIAAARERGVIRARRIARLEELFLESPAPEVVAVDIPIGLPESGARACDAEARHLLGPKRGSSVFPAPPRALLAAKTYEEAGRLRERLEGKRISKQTWLIVPKIAEVDAFLRRSSAARAATHEVHPEVSFYYLNGERPVLEPKRKPAGQAERLELLRGWCGSAIDGALAYRGRLGCGADDVLDAFAALWTAERIAAEKAVTHPENPELDAHGLAMSISA